MFASYLDWAKLTDAASGFLPQLLLLLLLLQRFSYGYGKFAASLLVYLPNYIALVFIILNANDFIYIICAYSINLITLAQARLSQPMCWPSLMMNPCSSPTRLWHTIKMPARVARTAIPMDLNTISLILYVGGNCIWGIYFNANRTAIIEAI